MPYTVILEALNCAADLYLQRLRIPLTSIGEKVDDITVDNVAHVSLVSEQLIRARTIFHFGKTHLLPVGAIHCRSADMDAVEDTKVHLCVRSR